MSLLINTLQARQSTSKFDSRIFLGILLVLIAGEKNLIVDVDVRDLFDDYQDTLAAQPLSSVEGGHNVDGLTSKLKHRIKVQIEQAEERVRTMVEYVSGRGHD
ncbi:hypothetical protein QFC19_006295 [Naganishia cerealis]|uniref:Uncharacterized protein n=1 Tax=Naganishia cerealis TaxID=610337 RepID=A0ACC2VGX0_9TREE|nr:hypothetical protein QFC19_006295 [Naganishia cerealis]